MFLIVLILLILVLLYHVVIKPVLYWKKRGVPCHKPWAVLTNSASLIFRRISIFEQSKDFYNEFSGKRYAGVHQFMKPVLMVRDLDLIKQITIKDFDHFTDHNTPFIDDSDPLMGRHLFALSGQKWRDVRATVSPSFTSSKMRYMFALMVESVEKFLVHLEKKADPLYVTETRELFQRFTNDAIASVVFGYNCDSIAEPENQFYMMATEAIYFTSFQIAKFVLLVMFPFLGKLLHLRIFPKKIFNFFRTVVKNNVKERENHGVVRPDMIQILMDARSGRPIKYPEPITDNSTQEGFAVVEESTLKGANVQERETITDADITVQAFTFFTAGFDAVSIFMCFVTYELALNVDAQEKLQSEIDDTLQACNGKITYSALLGMKYLDMVVSETLRKWSLAPQTDRLCVKDYEIKPVNSNEKPLLLEKGIAVIIPIRGLHFDPDYYPDPDKFDPERFNEDNKKNIQQFSYLPFGMGPRNCIASRFALLKAKILMFHLLLKFSITAVDKTPIPLNVSQKGFTLTTDKGFWLGFKLRKPS